MEIKVLTNRQEIEELAYGFMWIMSNKRMQEALKAFASKIGYSQEYTGFHFKDSLDECDEAYDKLDDKHILFSIDYPAADEDCEAYLSFEEFYEYIETAINKVLEDGYEEYDEDEIRRLLKEVKIGLGIS